MSDKKKSFVFYCDWVEALSLLPAEQVMQFLRMVSDFVCYGTEPEKADMPSGTFRIAWIIISGIIKDDFEVLTPEAFEE